MALTYQMGSAGGGAVDVIPYPAGTGTVDRLWLFIVMTGAFNGADFRPDSTPNTPAGWTLEDVVGPLPADSDPFDELSNAWLYVFSHTRGVETDVTVTYTRDGLGVYFLICGPDSELTYRTDEPETVSFTEDFDHTQAGSTLAVVVWGVHPTHTDAGFPLPDDATWDLVDAIGASTPGTMGRPQLSVWTTDEADEPPSTTWGGTWSADTGIVQHWTFLEFGIRRGWHVGYIGSRT